MFTPAYLSRVHRLARRDETGLPLADASAQRYMPEGLAYVYVSSATTRGCSLRALDVYEIALSKKIIERRSIRLFTVKVARQTHHSELPEPCVPLCSYPRKKEICYVHVAVFQQEETVCHDHAAVFQAGGNDLRRSRRRVTTKGNNSHLLVARRN